ncbi:hypothetical protein HYPSUDRAFT_907589 [Hypholoma sublateritium FD-334 SS-4]|uniref:DUF6533 domain-containing protein n=1 Tax=Hypholoma sublateritium (strain FD-334 SS-4) TaxID=945553 RepID=A0A0D2PGD0_HYPSF|nr:hypothetical protein HYPSUDRAFT_907589 [Hypholoma sublateritium FD-334 SS-4]
MEQDGLIDASQMPMAHTAHDLMVLKLYSLATFALLSYDIIITFGDEVEHIWKRKLTPFTLLWFLIRYVPPIGFAFITMALHYPRWSADAHSCDKIALFPGILGIFTTTVIGIIFIIRLYATYAGSKAVLCSMTLLLAVVQGIKIWAFSSGKRLQLPPGASGCILIPGGNSVRFTCTWIAELIFDSVVLVLTLYRAITSNRNTRGSMCTLWKLILRDGIVYFMIILASDLANVLAFLLYPADLKALNTSFTISIIPLTVSRLILNLRSADTKLRPTTSDQQWIYDDENEILDINETITFA